METKSTTCVYPQCQHTRRTRGLCHGHYQVMRSRVRALDKSGDTIETGTQLERDLERRGLLMPKGEGGVPARDTLNAFGLGSEVRGSQA